MIAGSDIGNGSARALTESPGCALICAIRARRVGSASAENVRSRARASYLTIKLTICCHPKPVKSSHDSHQLRPKRNQLMAIVTENRCPRNVGNWHFASAADSSGFVRFWRTPDIAGQRRGMARARMTRLGHHALREPRAVAALRRNMARRTMSGGALSGFGSFGYLALQLGATRSETRADQVNVSF